MPLVLGGLLNGGGVGDKPHIRPRALQNEYEHTPPSWRNGWLTWQRVAPDETHLPGTPPSPSTKHYQGLAENVPSTTATMK